ncbi:hypothetical protein SRHO_G00101560 [Serrasalmus rhombeus]
MEHKERAEQRKAEFDYKLASRRMEIEMEKEIRLYLPTIEGRKLLESTLTHGKVTREDFISAQKKDVGLEKCFQSVCSPDDSEGVAWWVESTLFKSATRGEQEGRRQTDTTEAQKERAAMLFSQGLRLRQIDMIADEIAGSSATLSKMARKYGRGRMAGGWRRRKWVFGMLGVKVGDTNQRKPVLRLVERRVQKGTHATHHSTCQEGIHYPK